MNPSATRSRLFVVHGYQATPDSHWFGWLCEQFPDCDSVRVALPNSHAPRLAAWLAALQQQIGIPDEHTHIVAHSLGCISTLHYLSACFAAQPEARLGSLLLVAGFAETLPNLPELDAFNAEPPLWRELIARIPYRQVMLSADDSEVSAAATERLSGLLDAPLLRLNGRGHFTQADGCTTLPEAAAWLASRLRL